MRKTSGIRQFAILLYKGLLLRKRHYIVTFFEIVIPVLIGSVFTMIYSENYESMAKYKVVKDSPDWVNASIYEPFEPFLGFGDSTLQFVYAPSHNVTENFMNDAINMLLSKMRFSGKILETKGTANEQDLERYCTYVRRNNSRVILIGTVFHGLVNDDASISDSLNYVIRYGEGYSYNPFNTQLKYRTDGPSSDTDYRTTYFLSWQASVEETFIGRKMNETEKFINYKVWMQRFPYPGHYKPNTNFSFIAMVPWIINSGYFIFVINMIRRIIEEKANGSKELLKMMGMTDCVYWSSTFMNYFIVGIITMFILTIIYKAPLKHSIVFIKYTDFTFLFFILTLYMANFILFGMAFTVFFNKGIFAIIAYIILNNASFSLLSAYIFTPGNSMQYLPLAMGAKLSLCLLPTGGLLTVFTFLSFSDSMGKGVHWNNLTEFNMTSDVNMLMVIGMMIASCILYIFMIWYFGAVWPWQIGVPKPFYFMFTKSYWCGVGSTEDKQVELIMKEDENSSDFFEKEPRGTVAGVVIKNLSKEFRTGFQTKVAVNDVSLNIFQGQITALLGHNGAGKTTTINILTGLYTPSSGTASINGMDILKETSRAREGLGVCPQHNVLFDTLTPEEHLKIYAALKGVPWSQLTEEASKTLALLKLTVKKNDLVKTLSGGMKRKLSLGIAIIGGSKVLFLDEPTSGMDVEARRSIWDTLRDIRHDRTIILTTHYMEEADILGDRIAIMAEGEIQCCGSSMFLKQKFGTGYHLHVVKGEKFDLQKLSILVERYVPGTIMENEGRMEVTFSISSSKDTNFGQMFEEMEDSKTQLGITSYGITITTMEDVFLNVANVADMKYKIRTQSQVENHVSTQMNGMFGSSTRVRNFSSITLKERISNVSQQFHALLLKRFHCAKRYWGILVSQVLLPFIFMCVCLHLINSSKNVGNSQFDALKLDIKSVYGNTEGFFSSQKPEVLNIAQSLKDVLEANAVKVKESDDPTPYILNYGDKDLPKYWMKLLVGGVADIKHDEYNLTAWYNGEPYHTLPMSLLLTHTALLKTIKSSATITLTNAPLPKVSINGGDSSGMYERLMAAIFVPLALSFLCASYVILPTHERTSKAKLLQLMNGIPSFVYWVAMFLWDFLIHIIVSAILIIPFAIFSHRVFFSPHSDAIAAALLLMLLNGWSSIPFSYLISRLFKKPNTGFSAVTSLSAVFGIAVVSMLSSVGITSRLPPIKQVEVFIWFMRLLPQFSITLGFSNLFGISYNNALCDSVSKEALEDLCYSSSIERCNPLCKCCTNKCGDDCLQYISPFSWDRLSCGREFFALTFHGFFYFTILLLLESNIMALFLKLVKEQIKKLRKPVACQLIVDTAPEDPDVTNERQRIHNEFSVGGSANSEALMVLDLTKSYKNLVAVDHLTFGIHHEECFGLLGVNGAGKTSTFMMLTGDCYPSEGNAMIQHHSLISNLQQFQSYLGYCPQYDALIDRMTGREMLILFGRLRGLTGTELDDQVSSMIKMTDLAAHADKQTRFYSGGNKRKLSIGIALIGFPPLILLDEPTAGVDPVSRRKIWNVLAQARNNAGSAVLLTTHSMEETEALCSRLAIMVNGRFRCLGSIQHLKSKYGQGYTLIIKMKQEIQDNPQAVSAIKAHVQNSMNGADLKNEHQGMLQYHVIDPAIKLHHLFSFMSDMKSRFELEDYLISETTLEQIFLTFARAQRICK